VRYETNALYLSGISEIIRRGISVQGIVCDGRRGLFDLFDDIPVQMCQFHQIQIVDPQTQVAGSNRVEKTQSATDKTDEGKIHCRLE